MNAFLKQEETKYWPSQAYSIPARGKFGAMAHELGSTMMRNDCSLANMQVLDMAICDSEGRVRHSMQSSNHHASNYLNPHKRPSNQVGLVDMREPEKKTRSTTTTKFLCLVIDCKEKFRNYEHLKAHMKIHEGVKPFACDVCGIVCKTESRLTAHQAKHVNDKTKIKCDICDRSFSSRSAVQKHKKSLHKPKPHICPHCNAGYEAHKYLAIHVKMDHGEEPPPEEETSESSDPSTTTHTDRTSPDQKTDKKQCYSPAEKDESPKSLQDLTVPVSSYQMLPHGHSDPSHHLREQSNPSHCGTHQMSHEQVNSAQCHTFQLPQDQVNSHGCGSLQLTRKQQDTPQFESRKKREENVPICCELCTSTFPNLPYLEHHMAVHLNERIVGYPNPEQGHIKPNNFTIDHRAYNYSSNGNFSQFIPSPSQLSAVRVHSESNKFTCITCNEQFLSLGSLKRHEARICNQHLTKL